jgi:hypothetical protein
VPGSRANLDHLAIGPGGVFVIDSKQYRRQLQLDPTGRLWHGRFPLAPALRAVSFEADQAALVLTDPDVVVVPVMAIHGTQVPWGKVVVDGVPVMPARRLPSMLRALPAVLGPERVAVLADQARVRFHAAAKLSPHRVNDLPAMRIIQRRPFAPRARCGRASATSWLPITERISGRDDVLLAHDRGGVRRGGVGVRRPRAGRVAGGGPRCHGGYFGSRLNLEVDQK